MQIGDQLEIASNHVHCSFCSETIGDVSENFKQEMAIEQTDIEDVGSHYVDPSHFVDGQMKFRKFYCLDCGTMLFTEIARVDDLVLDEFEVDTVVRSNDRHRAV